MSKSARFIRAGALLVTALLGGCATVPSGAGFDEVRATVAERTGGQRVRWNQGSEADSTVAEEVGSLLTDELTADEAVQVALLNNQGLQATYEDLMVAQADLVAAGLLENPIFDAEVRFPEGGGGAGLELAVVQEFLSVFQIPLRKKIAAAAFEATKLRVAGEVIELAAEVRDAYFDLQAARQLLEMRQTVLEASEAAYEVAKRLHAAGNITDLSLNLERAAFEQAKLDLAAAEYEVIARRERLTALMGLWGRDAGAWQVAQRLPEPGDSSEEVKLAGLEREAVANSLELSAIRYNIDGAGRTLGLNRTFGLVPELELGAIGEREGEDGAWAVGPVFSLPIPLFNQGQPGVAAAQAELRRARAQYVATAVELRSAVRAAAALLQNARARVAYYKQVVLPLRAQILEQSQLQYNAMQIGPFQLLQARQQQIEAGAQYIEALREYWQARSAVGVLQSGRFRRAEGGGSVAPASGGGGGMTGGGEAGH